MKYDELKPLNRDARYKMRRIVVPASVTQAEAPEWTLRTLEETHEDGWDVIGVIFTAGTPGLVHAGLEMHVYCVRRRYD